jgi:hypothetical protein
MLQPEEHFHNTLLVHSHLPVSPAYLIACLKALKHPPHIHHYHHHHQPTITSMI